MPEDTKNLGALNASTTTNFDLTNPNVFGSAAFLWITALEIPNYSGATLTVTANGKSYPGAPGAPIHIQPGGRIEAFQVTTNAVAVNSGELRVTAKGNIHPALKVN